MELRQWTTRRQHNPWRRSVSSRLRHVCLVWVLPCLLVAALSFLVAARG
jgi:hypothetical protein